MPHQRSEEARWRRAQTYEDYKTDRDIAINLVLDYSYQDLENGDKCYHADFEGIVWEKLYKRFGSSDKIPKFITRYEPGDVLNRFPITVPMSIVKYFHFDWGRGASKNVDKVPAQKGTA